MKKIPLFIFEEHHEAFFVWNYSVMNNLIKKSNNTLLHVDEHSDMAVPKFNYSINSIQDKLQKLYEFTYNELTIANFIVPAIYQGMFSQLYWLYQSTNEGKGSKRPILVYSHKAEGQVLMLDINCDVGTLAFFNSDLKNALFKSIKTHDEFPESQSVVLDIDLDYFSCNPHYYHYQGKLEVTKEQHDSFNRDKHHFLRFSLGSGIKSKTENGRYYLLFNSLHSEVISSKLKVSPKEIIIRIDRFIEFLRKNNVKPQLIDICRSRLSGFTPEDQWEFIEEKLIEKLSTLYNIEINHIKEVFVQERIEMVAK
jgi:flagellin-specific chaperone FliS